MMEADQLDVLWDRYPKRPKPGEGEQWVLREHLTDDDIVYNVERMRAAGRALEREADMLDAVILEKRKS